MDKLRKIRNQRGFTIQPSSKEAGFTMVEMILVIVVIAAIAAVVAAKFTPWISRGKATSLQNQLNTYKTQVLAYYNMIGVYPDDIRCLYNKTYCEAQVGAAKAQAWSPFIDDPPGGKDDYPTSKFGFVYLGKADIDGDGNVEVVLIADHVSVEGLKYLDQSIDGQPSQTTGTVIYKKTDDAFGFGKADDGEGIAYFIAEKLENI